MKLPLRYYGDPILRKKSRSVDKITPEVEKLIEDMIETSDESNAIGLAACQVGSDLALFVLRNYEFDEKGAITGVTDPQVYINPKICFVSDETVVDEEGCISIPGIRAPVRRPERIIIEAMDRSGKLFKEELSGLNARVRLHENDHLNGILYVDRLEPRDKKKIESALLAIKKKYCRK